MSNPILGKGNGEKVHSPENLNDYIKVSNIGVWILFYILHPTFYFLHFYIEGKLWLLFAPFAAKS